MDDETPPSLIVRFADKVLTVIQPIFRTNDPYATIDRLFASRHVRDIRVIFAIASLILCAFLGALILLLIFQPSTGKQPDGALKTSDYITYLGALFGVFGVVLGWAYRTGNTRLGIVDLFACELSTLCNVAAVVDAVRRQIENTLPRPFTSEEEYFSVFQNNTRALEVLEAKVVINVTAFYTYMKTVRDYLRAAAPPEIKGESNVKVSSKPALSPEAQTNVIYMMFLGFESARQAISDLVEYEPRRAEVIIAILISELEAYRFLLGKFTDPTSIRHRRLERRYVDYVKLVPAFEDLLVAHATDLKWERAHTLLPELVTRDKAMRKEYVKQGYASSIG